MSPRIGTLAGITDEFGELLPGTEPSAARMGVQPVEGDLVQLFHATDKVIYPPDMDGNPDPGMYC